MCQKEFFLGWDVKITSQEHLLPSKYSRKPHFMETINHVYALM